jgi:phage tail protein X
MLVRALQGETLDALCYRVLGRTEGVTEAALAANPGLADLGPVLPHGQPVDLPEATQATLTEAAMVQLWS